MFAPDRYLKGMSSSYAAPYLKVLKRKLGMTVRVIVTNRHTIIREMLKRMLDDTSKVTVVGEAASAQQTVELASREHPDVLLMDINLPLIGELETIQHVMQQSPETKVLAFSSISDLDNIRKILHAGASGYILTECSTGELIKAVETLAVDRFYVCEQINNMLLNDYVSGQSSSSPLELLSEREREVLQLLAEGNTNKEAAHKLKLSRKTIDWHRNRIMSKLRFETIADLIKFAIKEDLIML